MSTLLIMAAGMGSRYGTLKQIDRIGPSGETIIDYSVYDALRSGIKKVVFVIRQDIEEEFKEVIIDKLRKFIEVDYVFQELDDVPEGTFISKERVKPWGTGHAVWTGRKKVHEPFLVINADDFYGYDSFQKASCFLSGQDKSSITFCNIGYLVKNTLSDHGYVSRGELMVDEAGLLAGAYERTHVLKTDKGIFWQDDEGNHHPLTDDTVVSMNMWGFTPAIFELIEEQFNSFIKEHAFNPKAEFVIPGIINDLIARQTIKVEVIPSDAQWFGMTYKEDRPIVAGRIREMIQQGKYPERLWD